MEPSYRTVRYDDRWVQAPIPPNIYRPCSPENNETRLLELLPDQVNDAEVRCSMIHCSLNDPPFYTALSYEWGDSSQCKSIFVDDEMFPVTTNLESALRVLRARGSPRVWVDASVIVWVGLQRGRSEYVMQLLRRIDASRRTSMLHSSSSWSLEKCQIERYRLVLRAFFSRSFWCRVWIIQEIAIPTRVDVLCGSQIARWNEIEILSTHLAGDAAFDGTHFDSILRLCSTRRGFIERKPATLLESLYGTRAARATELRDKVFALLGVTRDGSAYVESARYDWTEERICISMTKTWILCFRSLDVIFIAAGQPNSDERLPSWCPDYFRFPSKAELGRLVAYVCGRDVRNRVGRKGAFWHATGESLATRASMDIINDQFLITSGTRLGTINGLGAVLNDDKPLRQGPLATSRPVKNSRSWRGVFARHGDSDDNIANALSRTLLPYMSHYELRADTDGSDLWWLNGATTCLFYLFHLESFEQKEETKEGLVEIRSGQSDTLKQWRDRNQSFLVRGKSLKDRASSVGMHRHAGGCYKPPTLWYLWVRLLDLIEEGLRLMTTEEDGIGWAHPDASIGDEVFLLTGCTMPAILRRSASHTDAYQVIGHAYMEGVMRNEVWSKLDPKDWMKVKLC